MMGDVIEAELRVLQTVCRAPSFATDLQAGLTAAVHWTRAAAGDASAPIRISVPDSSGRLRTVIAEGDWYAGGRMRSARRQRVFRTWSEAVHPIRGEPGMVAL